MQMIGACPRSVEEPPDSTDRPVRFYDLALGQISLYVSIDGEERFAV